MDVSKAFDSCDHKIIITKIKRTGLDPKGVRLIESYLLDRRNTVMVNGINGGQFIINIGVGQGTILGPTFFKIYIMDLHLHTTLFTTKFADDSNFVGSARSRDELETLVNLELKKVETWFINNRLTLHPGKSRFLVHSRDKLITLKIGTTNIMRAGYGLQEESVKMLGVEIDENLDWKCQVNSVNKKIAKGNYLLWRHGKKLNSKLKHTIYESFVRCHILYAIIVWGGASATVLKPLERTLSRIWFKFGRQRSHTLNLLKSNKLLRLKDELVLQESKFIWKWDNKKVPKGVKYILQEKSDNLRGRRFHSNVRWKRGSIANRLTSLANKSINRISSHKTKENLMKKLKEDILNSYNYNCVNRNCFICTQRQ